MKIAKKVIVVFCILAFSINFVAEAVDESIPYAIKSSNLTDNNLVNKKEEKTDPNFTKIKKWIGKNKLEVATGIAVGIGILSTGIYLGTRSKTQLNTIQKAEQNFIKTYNIPKKNIITSKQARNTLGENWKSNYIAYSNPMHTTEEGQELESIIRVIKKDNQTYLVISTPEEEK